jgi:hypothetical protein
LNQLLRDKSEELKRKILLSDTPSSIKVDVEYLKSIRDLDEINKATVRKSKSLMILFPIGIIILFLIVIILVSQSISSVNFDLKVKTRSVTFYSDKRQVLSDLIIKNPIIRNFDKLIIDDAKPHSEPINFPSDTIQIQGDARMYLIFGKQGSIYNFVKLKEKDRYVLRISGIEASKNEDKAVVIFQVDEKKIVQNNRTISTDAGARLLCYVSPNNPDFIEIEFSLDSTLERSVVDQVEAMSPNFESFLRYSGNGYDYEPKSTIQEGVINLTDINKNITLEPRECLKLWDANGVLTNVQLESDYISLNYFGAARKIERRACLYPKDITPSRLEWLANNQQGTLIYASVVSVLTFLFSLLQWWKSFK